MKHLVTATAIIISTTGFASAETYTHIECTNTDLAIGVAAGLGAAVVVGVSTVAASPVVGAAGTVSGTVGYTGAMSAPYLTGSTIPSILASNIIVAPITGTVTYYASCVYNNLPDISMPEISMPEISLPKINFSIEW